MKNILFLSVRGKKQATLQSINMGRWFLQTNTICSDLKLTADGDRDTKGSTDKDIMNTNTALF